MRFEHLLVTFEMLAYLVASALSESLRSAVQLQCPSCEEVHCPVRKPKNLNCRGGITRGVCNCCLQCAKLQGESCGGVYNYLGSCDEGLFCDTSDVTARSDDATRVGEGICRLGKVHVH